MNKTTSLLLLFGFFLFFFISNVHLMDVSYCQYNTTIGNDTLYFDLFPLRKLLGDYSFREYQNGVEYSFNICSMVADYQCIMEFDNNVSVCKRDINGGEENLTSYGTFTDTTYGDPIINENGEISGYKLIYGNGTKCDSDNVQIKLSTTFNIFCNETVEYEFLGSDDGTCGLILNIESKYGCPLTELNTHNVPFWLIFLGTIFICVAVIVAVLLCSLMCTVCCMYGFNNCKLLEHQNKEQTILFTITQFFIDLVVAFIFTAVNPLIFSFISVYIIVQDIIGYIGYYKKKKKIFFFFLIMKSLSIIGCFAISAIFFITVIGVGLNSKSFAKAADDEYIDYITMTTTDIEAFLGIVYGMGIVIGCFLFIYAVISCFYLYIYFRIYSKTGYFGVAPSGYSNLKINQSLIDDEEDDEDDIFSDKELDQI
eukprot:TRINITY_DN537_c0_g1_i1.p1 TRINITY_DN537_c0_g1~~TRINITY_DN537_c0_g1_i1.p1  ORF type:complete len:433 (+),score=79.07 TRINITY_DN537_c0_g1_i1:27-1301(+)